MSVKSRFGIDDEEQFPQDIELVEIDDDDDGLTVPDLTDLFEGRGSRRERMPDHHDPADLDTVRFPWKGDG